MLAKKVKELCKKSFKTECICNVLKYAQVTLFAMFFRLIKGLYTLYFLKKLITKH